MIYIVQSKLTLEETWKHFTVPEYLNKWLSKSAEIELKKRGNISLFIDDETGHNTQGCKIIELEEYKRIVFFWKGPEKFEITMNEFDDSWTRIAINLEDSIPIQVHIEHYGWKSSEDWQIAKSWHEKEFWPSKITKLELLLNEP